MPKGDVSKVKRLQAELREAPYTAQDPRLSDELAAEIKLQKQVRLSVSSTSDHLSVRLSAGSPEPKLQESVSGVAEAVVHAEVGDGIDASEDGGILSSGNQAATKSQGQEEKKVVTRGCRSLEAETLTATRLFWNLGRPGLEMQAIIGLNNCKRLIQLQHDLKSETLARVGSYSLVQLKAFDWKNSKADQDLRGDILKSVAEKNRGGVIKALGRDWLWPEGTTQSVYEIRGP